MCSRYKTFIFISIFLFAFFCQQSQAHSSPHYHQTHPYPVHPNYQPFVPGLTPLCSFNTSSFCQTYSGQICPLVITTYQPSWFNNCLRSGFFYICYNQVLTAPIYKTPVCIQRGLPCTCFNVNSLGYYIYDPGFVL